MEIEEMKKLLEQFIDETCLLDVLLMIQEVCLAKAQHIRENWQEDASTWEDYGEFVDVAIRKMEGRP